LKDSYQELQDKSADCATSIKQGKAKMEGFTTTLKVYDRDIQFLIKDKRLNEQHFIGIQKLHEDRIQKNGKVRDDMAQYGERFAKKDERKNEVLNERKAIIAAIERNQTKLAQTQRESADFLEKKTQTPQDSQLYRNELYALSAENTAKEIVVDNLRRFLGRRRIEYHTMLSSQGAEVLETKVVEEQTTGLTSDLLAMKMNAHRGRGKIEQLIREIDQYQNRASIAHSNHIQISEEVRISEVGLDGLNIRFSRLYGKIRTQEGRLETIQHERDLSCRQLEVGVADNSVLVKDNRTLRISIRTQKDDIRDKN
jgi:hypothetical protein